VVIPTRSATNWSRTIPAGVSQGIVDELEVIQIQEEHGESAIASRGVRDERREPLQEGLAVREARQRVVGGLEVVAPAGRLELPLDPVTLDRLRDRAGHRSALHSSFVRYS